MSQTAPQGPQPEDAEMSEFEKDPTFSVNQLDEVCNAMAANGFMKEGEGDTLVFVKDGVQITVIPKNEYGELKLEFQTNITVEQPRVLSRDIEDGIVQAINQALFELLEAVEEELESDTVITGLALKQRELLVVALNSAITGLLFNVEQVNRIEHNTYKRGKVQSLAFYDAQGRECTIGVILPGEYNFGLLKRREEIHVTSGMLNINGHEIYEDDREGGIVVDEGEEVVIIAKEPVTYFCYYG